MYQAEHNSTVSNKMNQSTRNVSDSPSLDGFTVLENGWSIFLLILQLIVLCGNLCLNTILCLLLVRLKPSLRRPTHILVWHQAVLSILIGVFCQSSALLELFVWLPTEKALMNLISTTFSTVLFCASVWNIALLGIDRYRFVVKFSTYKTATTNAKMAMSVAFVWIFSFATGMASLAEVLLCTNNYWETCVHSLSMCHGTVDAVFYPIYTVLCFIGPLVVLVIMFYSVGNLAKQHKNRMRNIRRHLTSPIVPAMQTQIPVSRILLEVKAARVLFVALSTYVVCFSPHFTILLISAFGYWGTNGPPININMFIQLLLFAHTLFDPFFYGFRDRHLRKSTVGAGLCWDRCLDTLVMNKARQRVYPEQPSTQSVSVVSLETRRESCKTSAAGSSLMSKEDLVCSDVLEVYRSTFRVECSEQTASRRQSWRYPKRSMIRRSTAGESESNRTTALRSIAETAAALALPEINSGIGMSKTHPIMWAYDSDSDSSDEMAAVCD